MNNPELIDFVNANHKKLLAHGYKFFNNTQSAEDCIQRLYVKLLSKDYGKVTNINSFIFTALYSHFYNFKRTNRRYKMDVFADLRDVEDFFSNFVGADHPMYDEQIDEKKLLNKVYNKIDALPENQKKAIYNRLNGTNIQTNTEKANYRHGVLKLKESLESIKDDYV